MIGTTPFGQIFIFFPIFCYMVISEHPKSNLTINSKLFQELIEKIYIYILWLFIVIRNRNLVTLTQKNVFGKFFQKKLLQNIPFPIMFFTMMQNFAHTKKRLYIGVFKTIKPHSISIYSLMDLILINFHIIHNSNK
jgi:hypothetical protein